jgi:hypothetical protein
MGGPRFNYNSQNSDSVQISPGGMISADVVMTSPGGYGSTAVRLRSALLTTTSLPREGLVG